MPLIYVQDEFGCPAPVEASVLGLGVSTDAGNVLVNGADGQPYLDCQAVQNCVAAAAPAGLAPWRVAGAAGPDGAQAQPTASDDVAVTAAVQHSGKVLIGGAVGDDPLTDLDISGTGEVTQTIQTDTYTRYRQHDYRSTDPLQQSLVTERVSDPFVQGRLQTLWELVHRDPATGADQLVALQSDLRGNLSNNEVLTTFSTLGVAQHVWFMRDGPTPSTATIAPGGPIAPDIGAMWVQKVGGFAEWFVMDGAGFVTQLSSHNSLINALLGRPALWPNHFSFHVLQRAGLGIDLQSGRYVEFQIDTGAFTICSAEGSVEVHGVSAELAAIGAHFQQAGV
jgi:hypothetical protein